MAFYRKLTDGWRLTDGILSEIEMEKPMSVYEALRAAECVPDADVGMNAMACEWISARRWVYSLAFEAPDEDDERTYVELPKAAGSGQAYLNGEFLTDFESGAVRLDLTGKMQAEENVLEIRFAPAMYLRPENEAPVPTIGLLGEPVLRTANYVTVEKVRLTSRMDGTVGVINAAFEAEVHAEGKYTFRYAAMGGDEHAGEYEFSETLNPGKRTVEHEIRVEKAVCLNIGDMEETVYGVKFTLERGGVGCDVRHMETAFRKIDAPKRCFAVSKWPVSDELIEKLIGLGADGIVLSGQPENVFEQNDFLKGLTVAPDGARADACGMISAEKLEEYAANEACWPADCAIWKLRGGKLEADASGTDAGRFAAAMRLYQAGHVLAAAAKARREKQAVIAQLDEEYGYFVSCALMERDGCERPALKALAASWTASYACCELPESGCARPNAPLQLNVWALAEELKGEVLKATVRVMNIEGQEIASTAFPVMGGDARMAGVISVRTPSEEGILIVRTGLCDAQGSLICQTDSVLAVGEGHAAGILARAQRTRLSDSGEGIVNEGDRAALSAGFCLMPGEKTDRMGMEWLNA